MMKKIILILIIFLTMENFSYAQPIPSMPQTSPPITNDIKNPLGTAYAENSIKKIESFIKSNNYTAAKQTLDSINQWVSDATEYHTNLLKSLRGLENADAQASIERELAIKFANMRDKLLFLNAKILIYNGQKQKAVPNLVEVVKSQPNSELGFQSYKILQEIGFTYGVNSIKIKTDIIQP